MRAEYDKETTDGHSFGMRSDLIPKLSSKNGRAAWVMLSLTNEPPQKRDRVRFAPRRKGSRISKTSEKKDAKNDGERTVGIGPDPIQREFPLITVGITCFDAADTI